MAEENNEQNNISQPIIIDLGKQKRRRLKQLKRGEGELWDEVIDVIDEVREQLSDEIGDGTIVPIILMYEKRAKRQKIRFPLM